MAPRTTKARRTRKSRQQSDAVVLRVLAGATAPMTYVEIANAAKMAVPGVRDAVKRLDLATRKQGRTTLVLPTQPGRAVEQPSTGRRDAAAPALPLGAFRPTPYTLDGAVILASEDGQLYAARPLVEERRP